MQDRSDGRVKALGRIAQAAELAFGSALAESRAGLRFAVRRSRGVRWRQGRALVEGRLPWGASIPEDAPIWAPMRKGTRVWKAGEEPRDED